VATAETLRELVEPLVRARRCTLWDIELLGKGATQILRISVDTDQGVDTDTLATLNKLVSRTLDEADALPGRYTLEVSSPGLERKLSRPEHFRAVAGRGMTARVTVEGVVHEGIVTEAGDDTFTLVPDGGDPVEVPYAQVGGARTIFEWKKEPQR
jgi:ribosome maturation factor RimP